MTSSQKIAGKLLGHDKKAQIITGPAETLPQIWGLIHKYCSQFSTIEINVNNVSKLITGLVKLMQEHNVANLPKSCFVHKPEDFDTSDEARQWNQIGMTLAGTTRLVNVDNYMVVELCQHIVTQQLRVYYW